MSDVVFGYKSVDDDIKNSIPKITVLGVGGAGCNAVNSMITKGIDGVEFIVANTDAQSLLTSPASNKIQLGKQTTKGLGAGYNPEIGEQAATESSAELIDAIKNSNILFIAAGMGGGTGSGAVPVIAGLAKEKGVLTIGIITTPFNYEGSAKSSVAKNALEKLIPNVDSYIIVPNQNLYQLADSNITFRDAFKLSDNMLADSIKSITDLIRIPGTINLDFADIKAVMTNGGRTIIGTSVKSGSDRAINAVDEIISNPMIIGTDMQNASAVLVNITANPDNLSLSEPEIIMNGIQRSINTENIRLFWGTCYDDTMGDNLKVSIIITGLKEGVGSLSSDYSYKSYSAKAVDLDKEFRGLELEEKINLNDEKVNMDKLLNIDSAFSFNNLSKEPKLDLNLSDDFKSELNLKKEPVLDVNFSKVNDDTDPDNDPNGTKSKLKGMDDYLDLLNDSNDKEFSSSLSDLFNGEMKSKQDVKLFSDYDDLQIGISSKVEVQEKSNVVPISGFGSVFDNDSQLNLMDAIERMGKTMELPQLFKEKRESV